LALSFWRAVGSPGLAYRGKGRQHSKVYEICMADLSIPYPGGISAHQPGGVLASRGTLDYHGNKSQGRRGRMGHKAGSERLEGISFQAFGSSNCTNEITKTHLRGSKPNRGDGKVPFLKSGKHSPRYRPLKSFSRNEAYRAWLVKLCF
jgi:hypothetical protein